MLAIGSPGGPSHHQLRGQGAGRHPGLGAQRAAGDQPAQLRQPQRSDLNWRRAASSQAVQDELAARGHQLRSYEMNSGLHGVQRIMIHGEPWWFGGADPRREGVARGD
ncbi:gamma-glutamyltransferase [Massilia sp. H-1]|nr:gamma-glutamyltransferase [Massilia sp. H-1]